MSDDEATWRRQFLDALTEAAREAIENDTGGLAGKEECLSGFLADLRYELARSWRILPRIARPDPAPIEAVNIINRLLPARALAVRSPQTSVLAGVGSLMIEACDLMEHDFILQHAAIDGWVTISPGLGDAGRVAYEALQAEVALSGILARLATLATWAGTTSTHAVAPPNLRRRLEGDIPAALSDLPVIIAAVRDNL